MQNKKQFRLKTIMATGWIDPKSTTALHSLFAEQPKSNLQSISQQGSMKKLMTMYEQQAYQQIHRVVRCRTQRNENGQSLYSKACMKQFPKREPLLKNSSPFRFFMRANSRSLTQPAGQQKLFFQKMNQITRKSSLSKPVSRLELKIQNSCFSDIRAKTSQRKLKQSKRRTTLRDNQCIDIQPWKLKQEHDFNDLNQP